MQSVAEPEVAQAEAALSAIPAPSALVRRNGSGGSASPESPSRASPNRKSSKTLSFSLQSLAIQPEWERRLQRLANAIIRGAGAGFCLRGGLNLVRARDAQKDLCTGSDTAQSDPATQRQTQAQALSRRCALRTVSTRTLSVQ